MNRSKILTKSVFILALFALQTISAGAQDLLARQAPADRRMKAVDTLMLQNLIDREYAANPYGDLYGEWSNKYAHQQTSLPDTFNINLRGFSMPTHSRTITSNFGARWGRQHKGLDIKVATGDTIYAAWSGKVRVVRYERGGYGNFIVIRHNNGLETIYGHLSKQLVRENEVVRSGQPIGLGGNTGRSTGSHLHFETRLCGVALNPAIMFDFRAQDVVGDNYLFRRSTYNRESSEANRLRGLYASSSSSEVSRSASTSKSKSKSSKESAKYHKVKRGETIYSIAKKRGVSVDAICRLNGIRSKSKIRAGQILRYS